MSARTLRTAWRTRAAQAAGLAALVLALAGCDEYEVRLIEKSMEPTIRSGEFVELDEGAYDGAPPERGDIVSFRPPVGAEDGTCGEEPPPDRPCGFPTPGLSDEESLIKRVIAVPGDRVAVRDGGRAVVNGRVLAEPYARLCVPAHECDFPRAIRVPHGHYFVMGDNRPYSSDSRYWGPIDVRGLEGRVTPPDR